MDKTAFFLSLTQYAVTLTIGVLVLFVVFFILKVLMQKRKTALNDFNFGILSLAILLSVAYLVSGVSEPVRNLISYSQLAASSDYIVSLKIFLILLEFTGLILCALLVNLLILFTVFYRLIPNKKTSSDDENSDKEHKPESRSSIVLTLLISSLIVGMSLVTKESLLGIIESLVPFPELPNIY